MILKRSGRKKFTVNNFITVITLIKRYFLAVNLSITAHYTENNFSDANTILKRSSHKKFIVNNFITVITHIYIVKMSL